MERSLPQSDHIFFTVFVVVGVEVVRALLSQANHVVVCIIGILLCLDHCDGNIGTMVSYTFEIRQKIIVDKTDVYGASASLKALDMMLLHFIAHLVNMLFQRFNAIGKINIIIGEGVEGKAQNLAHRKQQHVQLTLAFFGELNLFFMYLTRSLGKVHCVVADTLEITECVQDFGNLYALRMVQLHGIQTNQIAADFVFIPVNAFLTRFYGREALFAEIDYQSNCLQQILSGGLQHVVRGQAALLHCQRRTARPADRGKRLRMSHPHWV